MKIVAGEPQLKCNLDEFWENFWSKQRLSIIETKNDAEITLRGEAKINPKFRIPSADGGGADIFFNNREVLCRFANFPTPTQKNILLAIQQALAKHNVKQMVITIPWSKNNQRKLLVEATGMGYDQLDFTLIP